MSLNDFKFLPDFTRYIHVNSQFNNNTIPRPHDNEGWPLTHATQPINRSQETYTSQCQNIRTR
jgi:hypothetical protein